MLGQLDVRRFFCPFENYRHFLLTGVCHISNGFLLNFVERKLLEKIFLFFWNPESETKKKGNLIFKKSLAIYMCAIWKNNQVQEVKLFLSQRTYKSLFKKQVKCLHFPSKTESERWAANRNEPLEMKIKEKNPKLAERFVLLYLDEGTS